MKKNIILCLLFTVLLTGCQYLGLIDEVIKNNPEIDPFATPVPTVSVTAIPTKVPTAFPTVKPTILPTGIPTVNPTPVTGAANPICGTKELPSKAHLLWKPVSDTSGNAVVVFDGKYKEAFSSVKVELKAGGTENANWTGLKLWGNPDSVGERQHWRLSKKCALYKDNALITAKDSKQTCVFKLEGTSCKRIE